MGLHKFFRCFYFDMEFFLLGVIYILKQRSFCLSVCLLVCRTNIYGCAQNPTRISGSVLFSIVSHFALRFHSLFGKSLLPLIFLPLEGFFLDLPWVRLPVDDYFSTFSRFFFWLFLKIILWSTNLCYTHITRLKHFLHVVARIYAWFGVANFFQEFFIFT